MSNKTGGTRDAKRQNDFTHHSGISLNLTGEPDDTESGQVRFGEGVLEK